MTSSPSHHPHVEVVDVTCGRGKTSVLHGVHLRIGRGQRVAIVGPNGAGKSTLLRVLAGWDRPHRGRVLVGGRDLASMSDRNRATRLAVVSQNEVPPADLMVRDLVELGRLPYRSPWRTGGDDDAQVISALERLSLRHLIDRPVDRLSGGELRRVLVARALAQQAELLVLDEPTNHLDLRHQHELLAILRDLDVTVIAAIHDLDLAARYFDAIAVIADGELRPPLPPTEALALEVLRDAFGLQGSLVRNPATGRDHLLIDPIEGFSG